VPVVVVRPVAGYGFPTALGVKVAHPDRAVVSITGDGGFLFGGTDLATATRFGINLVTVVFNNEAYGNVLRDQKRMFDGRHSGSVLTNPDFVAYGRAFGVERRHQRLRDRVRQRLLQNEPPGEARDETLNAAQAHDATPRRVGHVRDPVKRQQVMRTDAVERDAGERDQGAAGVVDGRAERLLRRRRVARDEVVEPQVADALRCPYEVRETCRDLRCRGEGGEQARDLVGHAAP
jgi:hypothetical protein